MVSVSRWFVFGRATAFGLATGGSAPRSWPVCFWRREVLPWWIPRFDFGDEPC